MITFLHEPDYIQAARLCGRWWQAPGAEGGSTVISFAQKTFAGGALTSKLHVIELGAQPGAALPGRAPIIYQNSRVWMHTCMPV